MYSTELVVTATLCIASGGFHISTKNSCPASAGTSVLVRGQSMVILTFFEPRPSSAVPKGTPCGGCLAAKTGRGEGGLLCLRK